MDDNQTGDFDIENESQIEIDCVFEIDWKSIFYGEGKLFEYTHFASNQITKLIQFLFCTRRTWIACGD